MRRLPLRLYLRQEVKHPRPDASLAMGLNVLNGLSGAAPRGNSIRARRRCGRTLTTSGWSITMTCARTPARDAGGGGRGP